MPTNATPRRDGAGPKAEILPVDPTVRWAGAALAVAAIIFIVTANLYGLVLGPPRPNSPSAGLTAADRVHHIGENWGLASSLWIAESLAFVVMALSALSLLSRSEGGAPWLPRRAAWAAVAVGVLLQASMCAFMLGGYPAAIAAVGSVPSLFRAFNEAAYFLFYLSNATLLFGLSGVFLAEAGPSGVLPSWIGRAGAVCAAVGLILLVVVMSGIGSLFLVLPVVLLVFGLTAYLGFRIARAA